MRQAIYDGVLLGALFATLIGVLGISQTVASPGIEKFVLERKYGREIVQRQQLKVINTRPQVVVSNGDVLPAGIFSLYGFLHLLVSVLGLSIAAAAILLFDRLLLSGRLVTHLHTRLNAMARQQKGPS